MARFYRSQAKTRSRKKLSNKFPVRLSELINLQTKRLGLQALHRLEIIRQKWPQAAGEYVAMNVVPIRLIRKTLRVAVSDASWLTEMTYLKESIFERLQNLLPGKWVDEIRCVMGEHAEEFQIPAAGARINVVSKPTREMLDRVVKATSSVKDEQLNQALQKTMLACIMRLEAQSPKPER